MDQLRVEAAGAARVAPEVVWALVANADRYSEWGPWSASGYENLGAQAPDGAGVIRWMRYGRTTTVEKVLESERARRLVYTVVKGIPVRWSANYDQTVGFYRDTIGLAVLETFQDSYGLDGTILGLPGGPVHLEIVRLGGAAPVIPGLDQLVFYLPDAAARERITARLAEAGVHPVAQIDYRQDNGGVTYQDPDGREVVFAAWVYRPPA
jgi:catechol 2,3-dioxygenase-like lactoylglutathione lyase family enzyme